MNAKEYVLSRCPEASCTGPVKMYWPGQGERMAFIVTSAPHMSRPEGEGQTEEGAWMLAAMRLRYKDRPDLAKLVNAHTDSCEQCGEARENNDPSGVCEVGKKLFEEVQSFGT